MDKSKIFGYVMVFVVLLGSQMFFGTKLYHDLIGKPYPPLEKKKAVEKKETAPKGNETTPKPVATNSSNNTQIIKTVEQTNIIYDTITVENEKYIAKISERGGAIFSIKMKEYNYIGSKANDGAIELLQSKNGGITQIQIENSDFSESFFDCTESGKTYTVDNNLTLSFQHTDNSGNTITKTFVFDKDSYKIGLDISSNLINNNKLTVSTYSSLLESEEPKSGIYGIGAVKKVCLNEDGSTDEYTLSYDDKSEYIDGNFKWIGTASQYFFLGMVADKEVPSEVKINPSAQDGTKKEIVNYAISWERRVETGTQKYWIYAGPLQYDLLAQYNINFEEALFSGYAWFLGAHIWFPWLCEIILHFLEFLKNAIGDYGVAILILTFILKLVTYPLNKSSMESMKAMKDHQPELAKLREKYKSDPRKMQAKMMEFYNKKGISPFATMKGCIPMIFINTPVMIALFIVLRKAIELRSQGTILIPWVDDLSLAEVIFTLPFNIPMYGDNFALLPILSALSMFYLQKDNLNSGDPNQKVMVYMMPIMLYVMFNSAPAGLSLYFTFSNILQYLQQKYLTGENSIIKFPPFGGKSSGDAASAGGSSK